MINEILCKRSDAHGKIFNIIRHYYIRPKLSDSPYLLRGAAMPQTLLECDILNVWVMDLKLSPNG